MKMSKRKGLASQNDMQSGMDKLSEDMRKHKGYDIGSKPEKIRQTESYPSIRGRKPQKSGDFGLNMPDVWGVKKEKPLFGGQQQKPLFGGQEQKPITEPKAEEENYWSANEWEEWAYQIYEEYPDMRKYLPEWFNNEMKEN